MTDYLFGFLDGVSLFLSNVLPNSPVSGWVGTNDGLATGLGWLNWVFPVSDCLAIFTAWLGALSVVAAAPVVLGTVKKIAGFLLA